MTNQSVAPDKLGDVRSQAASRLAAGIGGQRAVACASEALAVLYELASSPATAGDALSLLHELQVHQIELELQAEELRESRAELESALRRQLELYDSQPVGCFTVDRAGMLEQLNLTGAAMLGIDRDKGSGRLLQDFLDRDSGGVLRHLIGELQRGGPAAAPVTLHLETAAGDRTVDIHARRDPGGASFLVVLAPKWPD